MLQSTLLSLVFKQFQVVVPRVCMPKVFKKYQESEKHFNEKYFTACFTKRICLYLVHQFQGI